MPTMRDLIDLIKNPKPKSDLVPTKWRYVAERPITSMDYSKWLVDFLKNGGYITHVYNYPSIRTQGTFFKSLKPHKRRLRIKLPAFYGASLRTYILDKGIIPEPLDPNEGFGGFGHNNIFYYDRMTKKPRTNSTISLYTDIIQDLKSLGFKLEQKHFLRNAEYLTYMNPRSEDDDFSRYDDD